MNKLSFEIKVDAHLSKKNSRPIFKARGTGRSFIGKSSKLIMTENTLTTQFRTQYHAYCRARNLVPVPINFPIALKLTFFFKDYFTKQGVMSRKLPDLSNLYELPQDCLQKAGVIENDTLVFSHDGSRRLPWKDNVLLVEISKFEEPSGI